MTRWTVTWHPAIAGDLAAIWIDAQDKESVRLAADTIDRQLAADPFRHSDHVSEGLYKTTVRPLRVLFEIRELDRVVEVVRVIHF